MISVCVPIYEMPNADFFLQRLQNSLEKQTYEDFELVITTEGKMAENTNAAIKKAKGDIIKILFMDDYLTHENSLKEIADNFKGGWLATGCLHDDGNHVGNPHQPYWNDGMKLGNNTIGSPSVIAFENDNPLLFDETMTWVLDADLYVRLHERYGEPTILPTMNVTIGVGEHQTSALLSPPQKIKEQRRLINKYD